jgi:hypothetical protein
MYTLPIFSKDQVVELKDIPQSSVGAPCPMIIGDEGHLAVIFYHEGRNEDWDGKTVRVVGPESSGEPHAVVRFQNASAYYHGAPNDEAFSGHPLYKKGLHSYAAFEIMNSSWRHRLMEMNRVHPPHSDGSFASVRHFVLAFHDTTFECLAEGYTFTTGEGRILSAAGELLNELRGQA